MVTAITVLSCLAVLAGLVIVECSLLSPAATHTRRILAGKDTPVWLADRPDPKEPVVYTRLEKGIVKTAIDYWHIMKERDGFPIRSTQALKMSNHIPTNEYVSDDEDLTVFPLPKFPKANTTHGEPNVLYPSILLVVDYDHFLPITSENEDETIKQRIIYALSFWYSVDFELQRIRLPWVELRIIGIVITRNRDASPYINNSEYYYSLVHSLTPMLDYWTHLGSVTSEFKLGSYDIVAHMTDSHPYREAGYSMYAGIASTTNPCVSKDGVSGVIAYDDLAFQGLHTVIEKMSNVFGDDSVSWKQYEFYRKDWTPTSLAKIRDTLKTVTCMSVPKEYYPPGEPVDPILAGELLPRAKQCEAHGFSNHTYHCWNHDFWGLVGSTCEYLKCSNHWESITCSYSNPTLDGTFCSVDNKSICMSGKCVVFE